MIAFSVPIGRKRVNVTLEPRRAGGVLHCRFHWRNVPRWKSTKTHDVARAKAFAYNYVEAVTAGGDDSDLKTLIRLYLDTKWPEPRNNNLSYRFAKDHLNPWLEFAGDKMALGYMHFNETKRNLQAFIDHRKRQGASPVVLDNHRRAMSGFFTWLMLQEKVPYQGNPAKKKGLILPPVERRIKPPASREQVDRVLDVARKTKHYAAIVLLLSLGMRRTGLSRLVWGDINLTERWIRLHEKKIDRIVPLSKWAVRELKPLAKGKKIHLLATHIDDFTHDFRKIKKRAGCPEIDVRSLRRAFLKKLFDAGVSPQLAAKIAGNSLQIIAKHYVDMETMDATGAVDVIDYGKKPDKNRSKKKR